MYYFGDGAPQNYSEARAWCLNAAAFDVCEAQSLLGRIYANGYGVSQNFQRAADWFQKAADQESAADQCAHLITIPLECTHPNGQRALEAVLGAEPPHLWTLHP